jgi:hypothetical protein
MILEKETVLDMDAGSQENLTRYLDFPSFTQDQKGWSEILDKNVGKVQATQSTNSGCLQTSEQ